MLVVDIQKFVTSMLANTDTPVMAHRPEMGQKDRLRGTKCKKSPGASGKHLTALEMWVRCCSVAFSTKGEPQCVTLFLQVFLAFTIQHQEFSVTQHNPTPDQHTGIILLVCSVT